MESPATLADKHHSTGPINHIYYRLPAFRPPRIPLGSQGLSVWDRVRVIKSTSFDRTGIIVKIDKEKPEYIHVHYDEFPENRGYIDEVHAESECLGIIPWPQHEGMVYPFYRLTNNADN